jgi:hypothetical protein
MTLTEEIERRGRLSAEFRGALTGSEHGEVADIDLIRQQARSHDTLSGLYMQWLSPDNGPEPPPNAWSWNACRLCQSRAHDDEWSGLERRSAEFAAETSFLGWLAGTTDAGRDRWLARFSDDGAASWPPRLRLMHAHIKDRREADAIQSNELALALLSSAALAPPEFVVSPS